MTVGKTKDTGWQIGVRRTVAAEFETVWGLVMSAQGIAIWLGEGAEFDWIKGAEYTLSDDTHGEVRVYKPESHVRVTYHPPKWPRHSLIQVRVMPVGTGRTTIAFHQEHLPDQAAREERRDFFKAAADELEALLAT